jgi:hypothetical protein
MNWREGFLIAAVTLASTACAPLQQAPLVYSSKQTLGVDLSSATTEQPGISLNLGFKSIDAAYVPVAVARPCAEPEKGKCSDGAYALLPIAGNRTATDSNTTKGAVEQAQQVVAAYDTAVAKKKAADQTVADAEKALKQQQDRVKLLQESLKKAQEIKQQMAPQAAQQPGIVQAAFQAVASPADARTAAERTDDIDALLQRAQAAAVEAEGSLGKARVDAAAAQDELEKQPVSKVLDALKLVATAESKRQDSYSVFGSFSANTSLGVSTAAQASTSAASDGKSAASAAGVSLGKIFSTGVAAQNLTEGVSAFYAGNAAASFAACLSAVTARYTATGLLVDGKIKADASEEVKARMDADFARCNPRDAKTRGTAG